MEEQERRTAELRFFGLSAGLVRERMGDVLGDPSVTAQLDVHGQEIVLRLTAPPQALDAATQAARERLGLYLYSTDGSTLSARCGALLRQTLRIVSVREEGTDGKLAAALPGAVSAPAPRRGHTCRADAADADGGLTAHAAQAALAAQRQSGTDIGLSTVLSSDTARLTAALCDGRRTWTRAYATVADTGTADAAGAALDLLRRYLEAYPAVMAGGTPVPPEQESARRLRLSQLPAAMFFSRSDSWLRRIGKAAAWGCALVMLIALLLHGYTRIAAPSNNKSLQDDLGKMYWNYTNDQIVSNASTVDLDGTAARYPAGMSARFRALYDIDTDIAGWIRISNTVVNYPVMAYADGVYEEHSFGKQYSVYGQPYFDAYSVPEDVPHLPVSRALVVRGKNTRDGQMFSVLTSYRRIAFLREHAVLELNTLYATGQWQVFAVMLLSPRQEEDLLAKRGMMSSTALLGGFYQELADRSLYRCSLVPTQDDRVVILSTNAGRSLTGERLLVAARLMNDGDADVSYTVRDTASAANTTAATTADDGNSKKSDTTFGSLQTSGTRPTGGTSTTGKPDAAPTSRPTSRLTSRPTEKTTVSAGSTKSTEPEPSAPDSVSDATGAPPDNGGTGEERGDDAEAKPGASSDLWDGEYGPPDGSGED